jgi:hypothetical protein
VPDSPAPTSQQLAAAHTYQTTMLDALSRWHGAALQRAAQEAAESAVSREQIVGEQAVEIARLRDLVVSLGGNPDGIPEGPPKAS